MRLPDRNALSLLKQIGIAGILSLTEVPIPEEIRDAIEYCHLPVQDFSAPDIQTLDKAVQFINYVDGAVAVHCFAGIGRTGTILAAYMISEGRDAAGSIEYIRKLRPFSIETSAQEDILFEYQVFLTEQEDAHD